MGSVIGAIIEQVIAKIVIPELIDIIRKDPGLTDAEVIAELAVRRARIIENGNAFLRETQDPLRPDAFDPK